MVYVVFLLYVYIYNYIYIYMYTYIYIYIYLYVYYEVACYSIIQYLLCYEFSGMWQDFFVGDRSTVNSSISPAKRGVVPMVSSGGNC